eukprot:68009-Prymnesium_polylepis.1
MPVAELDAARAGGALLGGRRQLRVRVLMYSVAKLWKECLRSGGDELASHIVRGGFRGNHKIR